MSSAIRSLRFLPVSDSKDRQRYSDGEVFYDRQANTLRIYDGINRGGYKLATETYVNNVVDNIVVNAASWDIILNKPVFANVATSGSYNDLTNKPIIPSIAGLATETYVTTAISNIPPVDLTGLATETYVTTAISNLVDTAPTTLDTLNELAAALGDDPNFATTVATSIGEKAPINNPTFTGTVAGITATMVGLGNVDNTADANKSVNYATTAGSAPASDVYAWAKEANKPIYTASEVGLGNVTNESKATMFTSPTFTGTTTLQQSTEVLNTITGATGVVTHNFSTGAIWYHSSISANFAANFTNVPTTDNRTIVCTLILAQGTTAYIPNAVQINNAAQTIKWLGSNSPTGNANKVDIVSFTLIRTGSAWTVLGSLSAYG